MIKPPLVPKNETPTKTLGMHLKTKAYYIYLKPAAYDIAGEIYFYRVSTRRGWPTTWPVKAIDIKVV